MGSQRVLRSGGLFLLLLLLLLNLNSSPRPGKGVRVSGEIAQAEF